MSKPIVLFSFLAQVKEIYMRMRIPHFFIVMLASCMQRYETLGFGEGQREMGTKIFHVIFYHFSQPVRFFFRRPEFNLKRETKLWFDLLII